MLVPDHVVFIFCNQVTGLSLLPTPCHSRPHTLATSSPSKRKCVEGFPKGNKLIKETEKLSQEQDTQFP